MDCYDIKIQRLLHLVEEQVYAAWLSYMYVTDKETAKEGISFTDRGVGGNRKYMMLNSPVASPKNGFRTFVNGVSAHTGGARDIHGARPALYH